VISAAGLIPAPLHQSSAHVRCGTSAGCWPLQHGSARHAAAAPLRGHSDIVAASHCLTAPAWLHQCDRGARQNHASLSQTGAIISCPGGPDGTPPLPTHTHSQPTTPNHTQALSPAGRSAPDAPLAVPSPSSAGAVRQTLRRLAARTCAQAGGRRQAAGEWLLCKRQQNKLLQRSTWDERLQQAGMRGEPAPGA
jgi:hypothetical protein